MLAMACAFRISPNTVVTVAATGNLPMKTVLLAGMSVVIFLPGWCPHHVTINAVCVVHPAQDASEADIVALWNEVMQSSAACGARTLAAPLLG